MQTNQSDTPKRPNKDNRKSRLDEALRANLRRRKTQRRERADRPEGDGARQKPV